MAMQARRVVKKIAVILGCALLLLALLVGAGVGYAWYTASQAPIAPVAAPVAVPTPEIQRQKPNPNAAAYASVQSLTTPVAPGENASITVKSNLEAICVIAVEYAGQLSKDSGLTRKPVDEFGLVTWAWTVGPNEPEGERVVKVTCQHNDKTSYVQGSIAVTMTKEPVIGEN